MPTCVMVKDWPGISEGISMLPSATASALSQPAKRRHDSGDSLAASLTGMHRTHPWPGPAIIISHEQLLKLQALVD